MNLAARTGAASNHALDLFELSQLNRGNTLDQTFSSQALPIVDSRRIQALKTLATYADMQQPPTRHQTVSLYEDMRPPSLRHHTQRLSFSLRAIPAKPGSPLVGLRLQQYGSNSAASPAAGANRNAPGLAPVPAATGATESMYGFRPDDNIDSAPDATELAMALEAWVEFDIGDAANLAASTESDTDQHILPQSTYIYHDRPGASYINVDSFSAPAEARYELLVPENGSSSSFGARLTFATPISLPRRS